MASPPSSRSATVWRSLMGGPTQRHATWEAPVSARLSQLHVFRSSVLVLSPTLPEQPSTSVCTASRAASPRRNLAAWRSPIRTHGIPADPRRATIRPRVAPSTITKVCL
ncbi:hypothetical protein PSPO01_11009 [Paraphaeosphaeria sporulosa]